MRFEALEDAVELRITFVNKDDGEQIPYSLTMRLVLCLKARSFEGSLREAVF